MYSAEVLSQLRSLNWLTLEMRRVPSDSRESAHLQSQLDAVRARLPNSILEHHDHLTKDGKLSAAEVTGDVCGGCRSKLPQALLDELALPGHFGLCPKCGLFLWTEESVAPPTASSANRSKTKTIGNPNELQRSSRK
jgi:predicted  nucleic acid-binding Zn-ribbon protein